MQEAPYRRRKPEDLLYRVAMRQSHQESKNGPSNKFRKKRKAQEREQFCVELAAGLHQQETGDIQKEVYSKLDEDEIVQSSALVECINSIIRPYLNTTKNHVTQKILNLIMLYHNRWRYRDGVGRGLTPMEILIGKEQSENWISIFFDIIRETEPELLLTS